jgi:hypothetical protein
MTIAGSTKNQVNLIAAKGIYYIFKIHNRNVWFLLIAFQYAQYVM